MKERPILFNAAMVRAILSGQKTQSRRIVKLPHNNPLGQWERISIGGEMGGRTYSGETVPLQDGIWHTRTGHCLISQHGCPGDRLWVRETWRTDSSLHNKAPSEFKNCPVKYESDGEIIKNSSFYGFVDGKIRPSIHMPRWASRITLEITGVRVERLNDISESDILSEGISAEKLAKIQDEFDMDISGNESTGRATLTSMFRDLWNSTDGDWDSNPWVWVIEFKRVTA